MHSRMIIDWLIIANSFFGQQIHTYNRNEYFDNAIFLILSWGIKFINYIRSLGITVQTVNKILSGYTHLDKYLLKRLLMGRTAISHQLTFSKKMITISAGRHSDHFTNMKKSIRPRTPCWSPLVFWNIQCDWIIFPFQNFQFENMKLPFQF